MTITFFKTLLLPLDGGGWLRRDVVHHSVDAAHLVADLGAHIPQKLGLKRVPVGSHAVCTGHRPQPHHVAVRALIPLHAHALDWQKHRKRLQRDCEKPRSVLHQKATHLPDLVIQATLLDAVDENLVHLTQHVERVALRHVAQHAHSQTRAREGVPRDKGLWDTQNAAQLPHFVFKELPQWLNELEFHVLGQAANVVVALDGVAVLLALTRGGAALDDVGVERALHQKAGRVAELAGKLVGIVLENLLFNGNGGVDFMCPYLGVTWRL